MKFVLLSVLTVGFLYETRGSIHLCMQLMKHTAEYLEDWVKMLK